MKKFLLLTFLFNAFFSTKLFAQPCSLKNFQVVSVSTDATGQCTATISFDMDRNNGNKFIYVHLWNDAEFSEVNKTRFNKGKGPLYNDINGSGNSHPALATVSIDNTDYSRPKWSADNYRPDNSVVSVKGSSVTVSSMPVSPGFYRYTVYGIPLGNNIAGGCVASNINGIVWSTQANSKNSHIHCSLIGASVDPPPPTSNDLVVTGSSNCATGMYTLNIQNNTNKDITGRYDIYADNGGGAPDMEFDHLTDTRFDGVEYFLISANSFYTVTKPVPSQYRVYDLWAQITLDGNNTIVRALPVSSCGALPVALKSFNALRNNQSVQLNWQTASEQNNTGFYVQRNTGNDWENIGFVASKATGGNSNEALSYNFNDVNTVNGVTRYRIQMMEASGVAKISEIRSVRGEGQFNKLLVYPNPSADGKINVLFEEGDVVRDVIISDMSGKIIKQWRTVTNNNLQINNLMPGIYSLRVVDRNTGLQTVEKLVINKN